MPSPLLAILPELTAVVGFLGAVFGALIKYQQWRNLQKEGELIGTGRGRGWTPELVNDRPAGLLGSIPAWVMPVAFFGGMVLLCGGCLGTFATRDRGPGPQTQGGEKSKDDKNKKDKGSDGSPDPDKNAGRKVPVDRAVDSWDEGIAVTFDSLEFRKNGNVRWHLTYWNKSGRPQSAWMNPYGGAIYVLDQTGRKADAVAHSEGTTLRFELPAGAKKPYWVEFPPPAADVTRVVAHFQADGLDHRVRLDPIAVEFTTTPDGRGVSPDSLIRQVPVGKPLPVWDARVECTLDAVEFRPEGRMRWRYAFWNKTGTDTTVWSQPDAGSYLTDQAGAKYPAVGHSEGSTLRVALPNGQRRPLWVEFAAPPPAAVWLTARFADDALAPNHRPPGVVLHLPPGKAGPMTLLTVAAEAGAAVEEETLDLTVGGGATKLHVTKAAPKAEATVIVPAGTDVKYTVRATTRVSLNGKEATYQGGGDGTYPVPADRRLVFVRDTTRGFNNFRAVFQEAR